MSKQRFNRPALADRICAIAGISRRKASQYFTRLELLKLLTWMQERKDKESQQNSG